VRAVLLVAGRGLFRHSMRSASNLTLLTVFGGAARAVASGSGLQKLGRQLHPRVHHPVDKSRSRLGRTSSQWGQPAWAWVGGRGLRAMWVVAQQRRHGGDRGPKRDRLVNGPSVLRASALPGKRVPSWLVPIQVAYETDIPVRDCA